MPLHPTRRSEPDGPPAFLTVEEAAAVLRIGRTAAYLLASRWEDTGGAEGLPVVRFGRLLRVPVHELERLAAGAIDVTAGVPVRPASSRNPAPPAEPPTPSKRTHTQVPSSRERGPGVAVSGGVMTAIDRPPARPPVSQRRTCTIGAPPARAGLSGRGAAPC